MLDCHHHYMFFSLKRATPYELIELAKMAICQYDHLIISMEVEFSAYVHALIVLFCSKHSSHKLNYCGTGGDVIY